MEGAGAPAVDGPGGGASGGVYIMWRADLYARARPWSAEEVIIPGHLVAVELVDGGRDRTWMGGAYMSNRQLARAAPMNVNVVGSRWSR